jgi:hypothetical protein
MIAMLFHCGNCCSALIVSTRNCCSARGVESLGWPVYGLLALRKLTAGMLPLLAAVQKSFTV